MHIEVASVARLPGYVRPTAMFSALALPPDTDRGALKHTKVFYYIMGFPLILNFLMAVLLFTVIITLTPASLSFILCGAVLN